MRVSFVECWQPERFRESVSGGSGASRPRRSRPISKAARGPRRRGRMATASAEDTNVDCRMQEWGMNDRSPRLQTCVRKVLGELSADALLTLKDSKLEVTVQPEADHSVWAYFPIHRNRMISRKLEPRPETRVLLVL